MRLLTSLLMLLALWFVSACALTAGTVGPDCDNCYGSIYTLDNLGLVSSDGTTETYRIGYTIDTSGFSKGTDLFIGSLALKVTSKLKSATLESTNAGSVDSWTLSAYSNVNNAGCDDKPRGRGWVCLSGGTVGITPTAYLIPYTWRFLITMDTGSLQDVGSIKANYNPKNGLITSQTVAVPEGVAAELPLAIAGFAAWFGWRMRSRCAASRSRASE